MCPDVFAILLSSVAKIKGGKKENRNKTFGFRLIQYIFNTIITVEFTILTSEGVD